MAINSELLSNLGCEEGDLPATGLFFDKLELAGIPADQLSPRAMRLVARIAVREEVAHGLIDRPEAPGAYLQASREASL
ncbi:MAG TPA: hypothetical protein VLF39_03490 [Candidatus Saccharimonadales bacterium]|nr:hypothetical protein [Candidatus Saccharimonadales bacterium]